MQKREAFKDVELFGRRWRIGKVDALTGSNILRRFLSSGSGDAQAFLGTLPDADFFEVQKGCLRSCYEIKSLGGQDMPMPILLPDGRWGVDGMENDTGMVFVMTAAALAYNLSSFFDESSSKEFEKIKAIMEE